MSYAIGNVIYGFPFLERLIEDMTYEDLLDRLDKKPFTTLYSSGGDPIGYIGVKIGEIDECKNVRVSDLIKMRVSDEQQEEFRRLFDKIPKKYKQYFTDSPDIWIVWSSS